VSTDDRFVGRARELEEIEGACVAARDEGRGSVVVVSGEAGIGKSSLLLAAAGRAGGAGLAVVTARCWPDGGAPPLWPWQPILDELCGPGAGRLLAVDPGTADVERDRFARFVAVTDRLGRACAGAPACVVVDDVHAADAGALLLMRFVARALDRLPLVVVLGRRTGVGAAGPGGSDAGGSGGAGGELLDAIEREARPVVLGSFGLDETASFLDACGFGGLDAGVVEAVHRVTGGHPLYLRRLVALGPPRPDAVVPGGLLTVIDQAVAGLPAEARAVLQVGAVLGPSPAVAEVAAVAGCDPALVLDAMAGAEGLAVVEGPDRVAFGHELVRAALERSLPAADRLDAHARAVTVLSGEGEGEDAAAGAATPERLARRAHHARAAAPRSADDARLAVAACRAAAGAMVGNFAYEQADALLSAAVGLHGPSGLGSPPGALLVDWAQAALRCGRMAEARQRFDRAAAVVEREDEPELLAEVALGLGGHWVAEYRTPVDRARVLGLQRAALVRLDPWRPEHEPLRCRLETRLAAEAVFDGDAVAPVLSAVEAARRCGDPVARAEALSLAHHVLIAPEHAGRRRGMAGELIRTASEAGHGVLSLMGLCWRTVDLFLAGDPAALAALEDLRERATALACRSILYVVGVIDTMLLLRAGRFEDAEVAIEASYRTGEDIGEVDTLGYYASQLLAIRWIQGREAELLDLADQVATSPTLVKDEFAFRASAAVFLARAGRRGQARAQLDQLCAGGGLAALAQSSTWLVGLTAVVELAGTLDDAGVARQGYDLLAPHAGVPTMGGLAVLCLGSTERGLGLAALATGDPVLAVAHLDRAVAANHRLGNRPLATIAAAELAGALRRRDRPGDRSRAEALLRGAVAEADAMGMGVRAAAWREDLADLGLDGSTGGGEPAPGRRGTIGRLGARWSVALDDRVAVVADRIGMHYLADLLTRPGQPVPALTLAGRGTVPAAGARQEVLDDEARSRFAARARDLAADLAEAEARQDAARAERIRAEMEALTDELESATGLAGRSRTFTDPAERARSAVGKAIRRALDAIDDADPVVAAALRSTVETGLQCCYVPDARDPVVWTTAAPETAGQPVDDLAV
jgi:hypothetical protein